jgi:peptide/nickel transport system permease protein
MKPPANAQIAPALDTGVQRSQAQRLRRGLLRNPVLLLGLACVSLVLLAVLFPAQLAPYDPLVKGAMLQMIDGKYMAPPFPPGGPYLLGTDIQARDLLSRLIFGARPTLILALVVTAGRVTLGTLLGWTAAHYPGEIRRNILLLVSMTAPLPGLLLAYLIIATIGPHRGLPVFIIGLALTGWASWTQLIYSGIMRIQSQPFMEAAEVIGATTRSKLRYYLVPNLAPLVIPAVAQELAAALLIVAELGFLGIYLGSPRPVTLADLLGGQQPQLSIPEWGGMLAGTRLEIFRWYWLTIMPAAAFMLTILGFNLLADGLRRQLERP